MTLAPPNVLMLCRVTRHLPKLRNVPASLTRFTTGDINCGAICLSGQASRCLYGHADTSCLVGQASNGRAGVAQISSEMGGQPLIRGGGLFRDSQVSGSPPRRELKEVLRLPLLRSSGGRLPTCRQTTVSVCHRRFTGGRVNASRMTRPPFATDQPALAPAVVSSGRSEARLIRRKCWNGTWQSCLSRKLRKRL